MKKILLSAALLTLLLGIVFFASTPEQTPPPAVAPTLPEPSSPEPPVKYPIAETTPMIEPPPVTPSEPAPPAPVPADMATAETVANQLLSLLDGRKPLTDLVQVDHFIQRFVVTVDNLPRNDLPHRQLPIKGASGPFLVQGEKDREVISPYNSRRYAPFVEMIEALDSRRLVDIYVRHYSLFQKAYTDLGYPSAYFNDRLVEVIDHLLETPEIVEPVRLERPGVLYRFADPDFENRSAGQKILLRIGNDNARKIKAKLGELRAELIARTLKQ
ncbi:MAG: hypothetical protein A2X84_10570 [Desulfuromonadaceae bacterium GWC2_58_13]|nr:MAG: hypothetical protein A2X84_10570 [Desulfuromonadaceae bacterium GWC2_58_13]